MKCSRFLFLAAFSLVAAILVDHHLYASATYWALAVIVLSADAICQAVNNGGRS